MPQSSQPDSVSRYAQQNLPHHICLSALDPQRPAGGSSWVYPNPSTVWFHTYATGVQSKTYPAINANAKASEASKSANLETKSKFIVTYTGFPDDAKAAFQAAVDIWSDLFQSSVPIRVNATWGRQATVVLGSTRPDFFYKNFIGAPAKI